MSGRDLDSHVKGINTQRELNFWLRLHVVKDICDNDCSECRS